MASKFNKFGSWIFLCLAFILLINTKALAIDKKASFALSRYIMAGIYQQQGDIDNAIKEYKQALKADYQNSLIHLNLAANYIKKNLISDAIEELKLSAGFDPQASEPHAVLALIYSSQAKFDLAASEYEIALENASKLQPKNVELYKALGELYLSKKDLQAAEKTYKLIIELSPADAQAHFYLANVYEQSGNKKKVEEELKKAIQLRPDYPEALNYLGYFYVDSDKNLDAAEGMIKKALQADSENGAYVDSLGWFYFKKGRLADAVRELEKASTLMDDPIIYDHLGEVYLKLGDAAKAKASWEKSLQLDAAQEKVKEKLGKIK